MLVEHHVPTCPVCRIALQLIDDRSQLLCVSNVLPAAKIVAAGANDHIICAPSPVNGGERTCAMSRCPGVWMPACTWYLLCDSVLGVQHEKGLRHYDRLTMLHSHTKRLDKADSNTIDNM